MGSALSTTWPHRTRPDWLLAPDRRRVDPAGGIGAESTIELMRICDATQAIIGLAIGGLEGWRHRGDEPTEQEVLIWAQTGVPHKPR